MIEEGGSGKARGNLRNLVDPDFVSVLSHPLRVHILDVLSEADASPSDLARAAGLGVNYVAYHVKELEKAGYVELVKTEPRRGTVEHYYRAKRRFLIDDSEWELLPEPVKRGFTAHVCKVIVNDTKEALAAGTVDARSGHHLSRTRLLVDEKGWSDLTEALGEMLKRVLSLQVECAERLGASEEEAIPVAVLMAGFETPSGSSPDADSSTS